MSIIFNLPFFFIARHLMFFFYLGFFFVFFFPLALLLERPNWIHLIYTMSTFCHIQYFVSLNILFIALLLKCRWSTNSTNYNTLVWMRCCWLRIRSNPVKIVYFFLAFNLIANIRKLVKHFYNDLSADNKQCR